MVPHHEAQDLLMSTEIDGFFDVTGRTNLSFSEIG